MPRRRNVHEGFAQELTEVGDLAIFEDEKTDLRMRVERLQTGMAGPRTPVADAALAGKPGRGTAAEW